MTYESGSTLVLRDFYPDGRIRAVECGRVVADDELGTVVWVGNGSAVIRRTTLTGESARHLPYPAKMHVPTLLISAAWHGSSVLILTPPNAAHCVWWFFNDDGAFDGWYINLQTPACRWWGGIDLEDQALDVVVTPDRTWRWKDEEDFLERTGTPMFWNATEAAAIKAEAHRVIGLAETQAAPFDGRWCDFRPEPTWRPTDLPWWWDLPNGTTSPRVSHPCHPADGCNRTNLAPRCRSLMPTVKARLTGNCADGRATYVPHRSGRGGHQRPLAGTRHQQAGHAQDDISAGRSTFHVV